MSENTLCNFCTYQMAKRHYEGLGKKVELKPSKEMPGWVALLIDGKEVTWFMEMPDRCMC